MATSAWGVDHGSDVSKGLGTKLMTSKVGMGVRNSKAGRKMRNNAVDAGQRAGRDDAFRTTKDRVGSPSTGRLSGGRNFQQGRKEGRSQSFAPITPPKLKGWDD